MTTATQLDMLHNAEKAQWKLPSKPKIVPTKQKGVYCILCRNTNAYLKHHGGFASPAVISNVCRALNINTLNHNNIDFACGNNTKRWYVKFS